MGNVEVSLNKETDLSRAGFVEVIGKVADSGEMVREFTSVDLGESGVGELLWYSVDKKKFQKLMTSLSLFGRYEPRRKGG